MVRKFEGRIDVVDAFEGIKHQVSFMSAASIALGRQEDAYMTEDSISGMYEMFDSINDQIEELAAVCVRKLYPEDSEQQEAESTDTEESQRLGDLEKDIVSRLARCREVYDWLKDSRRSEDVLVAHLRLNELSDFILRAATPAIELKKDFLALLNSIAAEEKNAGAAEVASAGGMTQEA